MPLKLNCLWVIYFIHIVPITINSSLFRCWKYLFCVFNVCFHTDLVCQCLYRLAVHRSNDAMRRQRLDDVRRLFVQQYCAVVGSCSGVSGMDGVALSSGSSGGMLTGLLENFAEKVGIRPARSSFYTSWFRLTFIAVSAVQHWYFR